MFSFPCIDHIKDGEKYNPRKVFCPKPLCLQFLLVCFLCLNYRNTRSLAFCVQGSRELWLKVNTDPSSVASLKEDCSEEQTCGEGLPTWPERFGYNTWIPLFSYMVRSLRDYLSAQEVVSFAQLKNPTWAEDWKLGQWHLHSAWHCFCTRINNATRESITFFIPLFVLYFP